jgi:hypothetical protein
LRHHVALHAKRSVRSAPRLAFCFAAEPLQAAVAHRWLTTSPCPTAPLPLFISYGGSNLVACMFGIGLLLNIYRQGIPWPPPNPCHAGPE